MLLLFAVSFFIGIQPSGSLPAAAQTNEERKTDESRQPRGSLSSGEGFKIQTEVNLATADITVIGAPVSELRIEDLIVFDNGVAQKITYFSRDQLPLAVAILIDKSGSTMPYLPVLQVAGITALRRLKPEDQVALFAFDNTCEKLIDLTEDRLRVAEKIGQIRAGGISTNIYDPLVEAASYLRRNAPQRRHAIILISDNGHNLTGYHDATQCRTGLLETLTTLYSLKIPTNFETPEIERLAEETGGDMIPVDGQASLKETLENVIVRLRMQYTIGFDPSDPGKPGTFHKLSVQFDKKERCPECRLLVRGGYYSGAPAPLLPKEKAGAKPQKSDPKTDDLLVQRSIIIAGTTYLDLNEIPFEVTLNKQADPRNPPQLQLDFVIDPEGIEFSKAHGSHVCKLVVAVFSADESGKIMDNSLWRIERSLKEEDYRQVLEKGFPFSAKIPLKANAHVLRIVVYDTESDRLSSRLLRPGSAAPKKPAK